MCNLSMQQSVVYFALCCVEDLEENFMNLNVAESTVDDDRCGFRLIRNEAAHAKELDLHRSFVSAILEWIDLEPYELARRSTTPSPNRDVRAAETDLHNGPYISTAAMRTIGMCPKTVSNGCNNSRLSRP